ncbi:MAG: hypothetical protein K8R59_02490 [Thermoanaerobaculales bacterium]|nr:hypothetical protein [Thermoanaerobaculales bacterium]
MTRCTLLGTVAWLALLFVCAALPAPAQLGGVAPGPDPTAEHAKAIEGRADAAYAALSTYQHTCRVETSRVAEDGSLLAAFPGLDGERVTKLVFARPDKFTISGETRAIYCDGRHVWVHRKDLGEYTESRMPEDLTDPMVFYDLFGTLVFSMTEVFPTLLEITPGEGCGTGSQRQTVTTVQAEERDGEPGFRVSHDYETHLGVIGSSAWYSDRTGLLFHRRTMSEAWSASAAESSVADEDAADDFHEPNVRSISEATLTDIVVDSGIPDAVFVFTPGPDDCLVDHFSEPVYFNADTDKEVAPSLSAAEGSLGELAPERLEAVTRTRLMGMGWNARQIDLEADGEQEIVLKAWNANIIVLNADGTERQRVQLTGDGVSGSIRSIETVLTDAGSRWLVVFTRHSSDGKPDRSSCGLYAESGEELWYYSPELPEEDSCELHTAAADLDGDGVLEVVVGLTTYRKTATDRNSYSLTGHRSQLVLLDISGRRLAQRSLGGGLESLLITRPRDRALPLILCILDDSVRVFELRP